MKSQRLFILWASRRSYTALQRALFSPHPHVLKYGRTALSPTGDDWAIELSNSLERVQQDPPEPGTVAFPLIMTPFTREGFEFHRVRPPRRL